MRHMLCAAGRYICELVCAVCVLILSWVFTLLTVLFVALLVKLMGRSMFWYSYFYAAICLYGSAAVGIIVLIHTLAKTQCRSTGRVDLAELFFDVSLLLWCCVLLFLTSHGWCSAYLPMMMVVFPLISKLLLSRHFRARGATLQYSVLYLMGLAIPYIHIMFLIRVIFEVFTPILGRSTSETPPDFIMALLVALATVILSSYFIHFIYLSRSTKWILAVLGSVFTLMFVLVGCGLFFPYSADPSSPRPKRVSVQHITRRFHSLNGSLQSSDSGFCINNQDYTGMQHITPYIPQINDSICTLCQEQLPYYGFPRFKRVYGPSHMSLYLHPHAGVSLSSWSFGGGTPGFNLSGKYFVFYSHGLDAAAWNFWFEIQPPKSSDASPDEGWISLAISAHYFSGSDGHSEQLDTPPPAAREETPLEVSSEEEQPGPSHLVNNVKYHI
ncbi:hypothetical protein cypCar_00043979 [Cyprinus carpio]|nr:hypothetical protein cypCar_00043979 [Cyprinus carpio]